MMYENYGLSIFGHAHSVELATDGEICFYFADKDIRDRALGRIKSVLKTEEKLPVSELCKHHKLLSISEHGSDRGWTKEDLDGIECELSRDRFYAIMLPPFKKFESPEETKEAVTDGDLGVFRNAFSFEETPDKGLKFSFKSSDDRDRAHEAFKNCLLSKKQITTSDLETRLLNFSSDWAIFVMIAFSLWPSDLGWEKEDLDLICVDRWACLGVGDDKQYDLVLPAPRKLEPKDEKMDKSNERSCRCKVKDCLFPGFKEVFKVEEKHGRIDLAELYFHHAEHRDTAYEEIKTVIETKGYVRFIDVLNSLSEVIPSVKSHITSDDMQLGWTPEDLNRFSRSDYGWSTGVMGETEHVLYLPAPHIISRSDIMTGYPLYPFKKAVNVRKRWNSDNDSFSIAIDFCTEEDRDRAANGFKKIITPDNGFVTAGNLKDFLPKNLGNNDSLKCHALMGLSWDNRHLNEIRCFDYMCEVGRRYAVALPSLTEGDGGDQNGTEGNIEADSAV